MNQATKISGLIKKLLERIVNYPDALEVTGDEYDSTVVVTIKPHKDDYGRVCGSGGVRIQALRTIAEQMCWDEIVRKRVQVDLIEGHLGGKLKATPRPKKSDEDWINWLVCDVFADVLGTLPKVRTASVESNHSIVFSAKVSESRPIIEIGEALTTIFGAIGRANGWRIIIDLTQTKESKQPVTNKGRFC